MHSPKTVKRATLRAPVTFFVAALILASVIAAFTGCSNPSAITSTTTTSNDADSQRFMDTVIPSVFGKWDVAALAAFTDKKVYDAKRLDKDRELFQGFARTFGPMKAYKAAHGTTQIIRSPSGEIKRAAYTTSLSYAKGKATISVDGVKDHGVWKIEAASVLPFPARTISSAPVLPNLHGWKSPKTVWLAMSEPERIATVRTAIIAYETGFLDGYAAPALRFELTRTSPSPESSDEANKWAQDMMTAMPTFSRPYSDYAAAIKADCLKSGCHMGFMWILPCMADKPSTTHGLRCHIDVPPRSVGKR